jgi:hypothetical protein
MGMQNNLQLQFKGGFEGYFALIVGMTHSGTL